MKKGRARRKAKKIDSIEELATMMAGGFAELSSDIKDFRAEVDERFEQVDKRFEQIDRRFEQVDKHFEEMGSEVRYLRSDVADIRSRIEQLEDQGASQAGYAKEIDYLLARVARIEKHLKLA